MTWCEKLGSRIVLYQAMLKNKQAKKLWCGNLVMDRVGGKVQIQDPLVMGTNCVLEGFGIFCENINGEIFCDLRKETQPRKECLCY